MDRNSACNRCCSYYSKYNIIETIAARAIPLFLLLLYGAVATIIAMAIPMIINWFLSGWISNVLYGIADIFFEMLKMMWVEYVVAYANIFATK